MKKAKPQLVNSDHKVSRVDYYQIFISVLMVILGVVILFRSFAENINLMPLFVGGGFLALGIYRLSFVVKYFRTRRTHGKTPRWDSKGGKWNHR
jgi:uncharacterized membrane protein HdeD (DUF308 family)